ncbi:MAG: ATP-dependent Clp protease adapter ClpS [Deltaproteobacteria bacterium]|nr:ATP-dependent Clp protease adapter ClpS [Deltaproteobacteria bacterium]
MSIFNPDTEEHVSSEIEEDISEPAMYRVLLHNDDYTSMEFVVEVLMYVFQKSAEASMHIMLKVHTEGIGLCGVYTYEVAETKVEMVEALARENGFPLKCTMEED